MNEVIQKDQEKTPTSYRQAHQEKGCQSLTETCKTPDAARKGKGKSEYQQRNFRIVNEFEDYVIRMFDPHRFELIHRTPTNRDTDGKFVSSMVYPDLRFREISTGRTFWVEVKYRSHTEESGNITWCTHNQLHNHKMAKTTSNEPVFIVIEIGGCTNNPDKIYGIKLDRVDFTTLYHRTYVNNRIYYKKINSFDQLRFISSLGRGDTQKSGLSKNSIKDG